MPSSDKNSTHLQIGVITRPHGVRGELKVRLHNEESSALKDVRYLVAEGPKGNAERFEVESVRGSSKGPIMALTGVSDRSRADGLRGWTLWVERSQIAPLEEGEYYLVDLVGCRVTLDGVLFAMVTGVRPDPSVDTMILKLQGGDEAEVPIVDAWVGCVDIKEKSVELLSTDGLIEA